MMQAIKERAAKTLLPLARRVVTPVLLSGLGDQIGFVRVAKRFARQWAASAGLFEHEAAAEAASPNAAANSNGARPESPAFVPTGDQRPLTLYTTRRHSSCKTAKKILDGLAIAYTEVDLSDDEDARQRLYRETEDRTFPQVYIDGQRLGGFDDLVVAREEGRLMQLLYPNVGSA